jgi:transposase
MLLLQRVMLRVFPTLGVAFQICWNSGMPDTRRINMRKIRDVLRLKLEARLSHEQTAAALRISKGVVTKYLALANTAGLDWAQIQTLDDTALHNQMLGSPKRVSGFVQPDYGLIHHELRRKGMTLMLRWEEHGAQHPSQAVHRDSQFCENYRRYAKSLKRSMRQIHRAGEKLFIDYAGPTIALNGGGRAHIFVAALGASSYTFACATPRETMADWLGATAQALRFIGGVPQFIVPDNTLWVFLLICCQT